MNLQKQLNLSSSTLEKLAKLNLHSITDIILHLPLRYEDETKLSKVNQAIWGQPVLIEGTIIKQTILYQPKQQLLLQVSDSEHSLFYIRLLHFYPNQLKQYCIHVKIRAFGELKKGFYGPEMIHPKISTQFSERLNSYLTPIYPTVNGLSQKNIRIIIENALKFADLEDTLPDILLKQNELVDFKTAIMSIHFSKPPFTGNTFFSLENPALRRLKFDELLAQQFSMKLIKAKRKTTVKPILNFKNQLKNLLLKSLSFKLTSAQEKVLKEIELDLRQPHPMHRLLQGDVGSGKTIVSALTALMVIEAGYQVALIAPTEILAEQHFEKFTQWFHPLGIEVAWLSGNQKLKDKKNNKFKLKEGIANIAIGTHALIQKDVEFQKLGLVIIDEQHRFGVNQRLELKQKGENVHQLMMSATPIPRTLSMTYFADVDISIINELPPNRIPVKTILISEHRRQEVEQFMHQKIKQGRQVYWVCPLIEESENLQLQTAIDTYQSLQNTFPNLKIGLVHGRLKSQEKAQIMDAFKHGQIQLLVATTVIEVGVDVPNASIMIIEHSERMGLSQLHQLRGRVGRGENMTSKCILFFSQPLSDTEKKRLKIIYENNDGFEIARQDLLIRGPGEFLGAKQSGIPLLRFANINEDTALLELAQNTAQELLKTAPEIVEKHLNRWLPNREVYLGV